MMMFNNTGLSQIWVHHIEILLICVYHPNWNWNFVFFSPFSDAPTSTSQTIGMPRFTPRLFGAGLFPHGLGGPDDCHFNKVAGVKTK
jgi:hypothetical protein